MAVPARKVRDEPVRKLLITPGKPVKRQKLTLSARVKFLREEQARLDAVIAGHKEREKATALVTANYNAPKPVECGLDFTLHDKPPCPDFDLCNNQILLYLAAILPSTRLVNVVIDTVTRCNYRVFCDALVVTIIEDISQVCVISGMFTDQLHKTRVLIPKNLVCSRLSEMFVADAAGTVTIYMSTNRLV